MVSDEDDYVFIQPSSMSDVVSMSSLSDRSSSRTPTPVLAPSRRTIHSLDDNILAEIFRVLSSICRPVVAYGGHNDLGYILASHVCQSWRTIMISCPDLWVTDLFTFPNGQAVHTILERTRDLPLDIDLTANDAQSAPWRTSLCFNLLPRIRSLHISTVHGASSRDDLNELIRSIIAQGAPTLQHLDITQYSIRVQDQFPDLVFFAPSLRSLRLNGVFFSCLSTSLTFVHLQVARSFLQFNHSGASVLDVLRGSMETLEYIILDVLPNLASPGQRVAYGALGKDIHLFNAKAVSYRGPGAEVLEPLHLPPNAFVHISLDAPVVRVVEDVDDVLIARIAAPLLTDNSYALSFGTERENAYLSIQCLSAGIESQCQRAHTPVARAHRIAQTLYEFKFMGSCDISRVLESGILVQWCPSLSDESRTGGELMYVLLELARHAIRTGANEDGPFGLIHYLDVCTEDDLLDAEWAEFLRGYTAVATLRMHIASAGLLSALGVQSTLLPNLTTIVLVIAGMDNAEDYREHQRVRGLVEALEKIVLRYLVAGRDNSIEYVRLEGKSDSRAFAEMVKERLSVYVPHVEVALY